MAECKKCGATEAEADFYASVATYCKEHWKDRVRKNRESKKEYYRMFDRQRANAPSRVVARQEYTKTQAGAESHRAANERYIAANQDKAMARNAVSNALRDGKLIREVCEVCHDQKSEAHHDDYSKPLDVRWLCSKHHSQHHKAERQVTRPEHEAMPVLNIVTKSGSVARLGTFKCLPMEQLRAYVKSFDLHWISV